MAHPQEVTTVAPGIPGQRSRKSTAEVSSFVLAALADGKLTLAQLRELASQESISESSLQRALRSLMEDGRVDRVRRGVYEIKAAESPAVDHVQSVGTDLEPTNSVEESAERAVIAAPIVPAARAMPPRRRVRAHPAAVSPQASPPARAPKVAPPKPVTSVPAVEPELPTEPIAMASPAVVPPVPSELDEVAEVSVPAPIESITLTEAELVPPGAPQTPTSAPPATSVAPAAAVATVALRQPPTPSAPVAARDASVASPAATSSRWDPNRRFLAWSGTFVLWAVVVGVVLIALPGVLGLAGVVVVTLGIGYGFQQLVLPHLRGRAGAARTSPSSAPRSLSAIGLG